MWQQLSKLYIHTYIKYIYTFMSNFFFWATQHFWIQKNRAPSVKTDLYAKLSILVLLVTTQEVQSQMSVSRELFKFSGIFCIY